MSVVFIGYKILEVDSVENFKTFFRIFTARLLGVLLPLLFFAFYLTDNNIWAEFFDYAIFGISTFSNNVSYLNLFHSKDAILRVLAIELPIVIIILFIILIASFIKTSLREKEYVRNLYLLLMYSIATLVVIFPIADKVHFGIGSMCTLISGIYLVYIGIKYLLDKLKNKKISFGIKTFIETVSFLLLLVCILNGISSLNVYAREVENYGKIRHFNYIAIDSGMYDRIKTVNKYILYKEKEGKEVIIADSTAAAYNIPLDRYYKDYDMFLIGNIGSKGEKRNNRRLRKKKEYINTCCK